MFYRGYPILTALARPEALPSTRAPGALAEWAESSASRALHRDFRTMHLSERLSDPAEYLQLQHSRRQSLEALLLVAPEKSTIARAANLICMIAEESIWSENAALTHFDDDAHPEIDFQCAETALLFGWTCRAMGDKLDALSPPICNKMLYEVRRRVFAPFLAHNDYPFMRGRGYRPLSILSDILLTAVLLETDTSRRNAILKQALRMLDHGIDVRTSRHDPLADSIVEIGAITDLSLLIRKITRGEMDLTQIYPTPDWLDELLFSWVTDEYFVDPAGENLKPPVSGEEIFRIGLAANDQALTALGAHIHRAHRRPSASLTGRILDMSYAPMLAAEFGKPPRLKHAATAGNALMISRFAGMVYAMHRGGENANVGDFVLFASGRPILTCTTEAKNLPIIAGHAQLKKPDLPCEADFEVSADREMMSIDLTHAYPATAVIRSYQRTAMIMRAEGMLRLVDAFDLSEPGIIVFQFITPETPIYTRGALQIGPIDLMWEGDLTLFVAPLPNGNGLNRIELVTLAPVTRAFFNFKIYAAGAR